MGRSISKLIVATAMLLAHTPSFAHADQITLRYLLMMNKVEGLKKCALFEDAGVEAGDIAFQQRFPNCANLVLLGRTFGHFFAQEAIAVTADQSCYESGYKLGFFEAYNRTWDPCAAELTKEIAAANASSLAACKALSGRYEHDLSVILKDASVNHKDDAEIKVTMGRALMLASLGMYEDAWNRIVALQGKEQKGLVPCMLLISNKFASLGD